MSDRDSNCGCSCKIKEMKREERSAYTWDLLFKLKIAESDEIFTLFIMIFELFKMKDKEE